MNIKQNVAKKQRPKTGSRTKHHTRTKQGLYAPKLTTKQKAFADERLKDLKASGTEIAMRTYNTTDRNTAGVIAAQNLRNYNIQLYMNEHVDKAVSNIVKLADTAENETVRLNANKDILDRTTGKAIQRTEQVSTGVTLNIDLSGTGVSEDAVTDRDTL